MAYALKGTGVVLKSDIEKRNLAAFRAGRAPVPPVVSSLFIHSRASYSGGVGSVLKNNKKLEDNPYLNEFLKPEKHGTNFRVASLKTFMSKEVAAAAEADAELGLNFTIERNWKKAAQRNIIKEASVGATSQRVFQKAKREAAEMEDGDEEAIWKRPAASKDNIQVFRGKTAGERRERSYTADGAATHRPYSEQDPRMFFSAEWRAQEEAAAQKALQQELDSQQASRAAGYSPPPRRGSLRISPTMSPSAEDRRSPNQTADSFAMPSMLGMVMKGSSLNLSADISGMSNQGLPRDNVGSASSTRRVLRPSSAKRKTERPKLGWGWGPPGEEEAAKQLDMPDKPFDEAPEEWHAFAQRCFLAGDVDLARRALQAIDSGAKIIPKAEEDE